MNVDDEKIRKSAEGYIEALLKSLALLRDKPAGKRRAQKSGTSKRKMKPRKHSFPPAREATFDFRVTKDLDDDHLTVTFRIMNPREFSIPFFERVTGFNATENDGDVNDEQMDSDLTFYSDALLYSSEVREHFASRLERAIHEAVALQMAASIVYAMTSQDKFSSLRETMHKELTSVAVRNPMDRLGLGAPGIRVSQEESASIDLFNEWRALEADYRKRGLKTSSEQIYELMAQRHPEIKETENSPSADLIRYRVDDGRKLLKRTQGFTPRGYQITGRKS